MMLLIGGYQAATEATAPESGATTAFGSDL
jgi:hypothetical protein